MQQFPTIGKVYMDRIAAYFSDSYTQARAKFLAAVQTGGGRLLSSHTNPEKGPEGEDCIADVAWLGPEDASKLLILVSGTHGAEGYAGSGCQVASPARNEAPVAATARLGCVVAHRKALGCSVH